MSVTITSIAASTVTTTAAITTKIGKNIALCRVVVATTTITTITTIDDLLSRTRV